MREKSSFAQVFVTLSCLTFLLYGAVRRFLGIVVNRACATTWNLLFEDVAFSVGLATHSLTPSLGYIPKPNSSRCFYSRCPLLVFHQPNTGK